MSKKILGFLLASVMTLLLTACSGESNPDNKKDGPTSVALWQQGEITPPGDLFDTPKIETSEKAPILAQISKQVYPGSSFTVSGEGFLTTDTKAFLYSQSTNSDSSISTKLPISLLEDLAGATFGYSYDFKRNLSAAGFGLLATYDQGTQTVTVTEVFAPINTNNGFVYKGFKQNGDSCTVEVYYKTYFETQPSGTQGVHWDKEKAEGKDLFYSITKNSQITIKYDGKNWIFKSFLPK